MKKVLFVGVLALGGCSLLPGDDEPSIAASAAKAAVATAVPGGSLVVEAASRLLTRAEPDSIGLADWREKVDDCADEESDNFRRALDITDPNEVRLRCEVLLEVPCWATEAGCPK